MMKKIQHDNIRSIAVTQQALNEIYAHFDEFHKTTVWQEECRSWFKDGKQKNRIYLWPGPVSAAAPLITPRRSRATPLASCAPVVAIRARWFLSLPRMHPG